MICYGNIKEKFISVRYMVKEELIMVDENLQISETFEPTEEFVVSDLETLKVLADPMRLSILEFLSQPGTVKLIAEKLNKPPTKLYYHFNLLEKHGLIQMVDTRIVSGIIEKHYQASARMYLLKNGLLSPGTMDFDESLELTLTSLFSDVRNDVRQSIQDGMVDTADDAPESRRLVITQGRLSLTPDKAQAFYERLVDLVQEFQEMETHSPGARSYKMLFLLHPSSRGTFGDED